MKTFILFISLFMTNMASADEPKKLSNGKYSEIDVVKNKNDKGTEVHFKVKMADGIKYNWDGPWKLKITGEGIKEQNFGTSDFNKEKAAYIVALPQNAKKVNYRLTTFICTEDKTRCYREIHSASFDI